MSLHILAEVLLLGESSSWENWLWWFHMLSNYLHSIAVHKGGYDCNNSTFVLNYMCEGEIFEQSAW